MAKKKLGIVADSTCDLHPDLIKKYDVGIIPLKMVFDNNEVRYQGVDITNEEFYRRLIDGELPTTGAPSPKAFKEVIDKKLEEFEEVLVFCIGNKLSATYSTASMVKKQFYDDRVTVIDTNTLSITISLILLPALRMAADGASKEEILDFVKKTKPHTQVFGGAESLKYLHKGGRLSRASYLIGSLLHLKPLVSVDEGLVVSPGRVRGFDGLMEHMRTVAGKIVENRKSELVIVGHCANLEKAEEAAKFLTDSPNAPKEVVVWDIGPVIGTHLGPGTIGYVWVGEFKEEWIKPKRDLRFWKSGDENES